MTRVQQQIIARRQGETCIAIRDSQGRPLAGADVWVEQESHAFIFGGVLPDLADVPERDAQRCRDRFHEIFNRAVAPGEPADSRLLPVHLPEPVQLGRFYREQQAWSERGEPLEVRARGRSVAPEIDRETAADQFERAFAERVAELYSICFASPGVRAIVWDGFWDGEPSAGGCGLLQADFAPKRAFHYLRKLVGMTWHTRAAGQSGADGCFRFRGYFGDYRVAARHGPAPATTGLLPFRPGSEEFVLRLDG